MNSKLTGIIVVGVLAASMGGVLLFLDKTGGQTDSSSADESSSAVIKQKENNKTQLVDRSAEDVVKVAVTNKSDSFVMERNNTGKTVWNIDALPDLTLSLSEENGLADCAATLKSFDTVEENAGDMSKYGFDDPTSTFTVTFSDGEERTFVVGNMLPNSDRYYYLHEEGSNTVYQVLETYLSYMVEPKEEYITKTLIVQPGSEAYPEYGTLTVKRKDLDYDIVIENDDNEKGAVSAQIMTSPVYGYLNISNSTAFTHGMWGLTAETAVKIKPTDDDLREYGLDDPTAVVTLKGEGYDYTLNIGAAIHEKDEDGNDKDAVSAYYCTLEGAEGLDCVFRIPAASLPWATNTPENILSSLMTFNYIEDVSEIVITKDGKTDDILLTYDAGKEDIGSATLNGKSLEIESLKTFYEYILTCPTDEVYFTEPDESTSIMKIEIKRTDGGGDTLEYFADTGRRTIVKLNGITSYRIKSTWITQLEENITNLEAGKKIGETY